MLSAQIQLCSDGEQTAIPVMGGEYIIMNNVWGAKTKQCVKFYEDSTYFRVIYSEHNNTGGTPAAYPAIFKGCHWGSCTGKNNPLSIQIKKIKEAPITWIIDTRYVDGTWNAAFDGWFDKDEIWSGSDKKYDAELMIWIDYGGGAGPSGTKVTSVDIADHKWDLYFARRENWAGWNYIAYKTVNPIDTLDIDLLDFIRDATSRGYMYSDWYFVAAEVGFEIWIDGKGLTTNRFSFDAEETNIIINYAPSPFSLKFPVYGMTLPSMNVYFSWTEAIDPDRDSVEYILNISGSNIDTMMTGINGTEYSFDGSGILEYNTTYHWRVLATDGIDTTYTKFSLFKTPSLSFIRLQNGNSYEIKLIQNFPNPFNKKTYIKFEVSIKTNIELEIFDITGKRVKNLFSGEVFPGEYIVIWDGSNFRGETVESGLYFCMLKNIELREIKKILYLK